MNLAPITKRDYLYILLLWTIVVLIFYPLFTAEYVYTDEIVQLWQYKKGNNFNMFLPQGRLITEKLFRWLFSSATAIHDITYIRLFSLAGWMLSIPLWYVAIKRIVVRENLPEVLTFFSLLFLVCSQQFCIYVSWAACLELFLANTAGLLSGYYLYLAISEWRLNRKRAIYLITVSIITGQISIFSYQSGFGCFLLPFVLHLIKEGKLTRSIIIAVTAYLMMYGLYYVLWKLSLNMIQAGADSRTDIVIDPLGKLKFLLMKVMTASFHFNYIMNENDKLGKIISRILFAVWLIFNFIQQKKNTIGERIAYPFVIVAVWGLIYLPSLIVKENYASNRTLLALNLSVFFLVMHTLITAIQKVKVRRLAVAAFSLIFIVNAWYNFHKLFLEPVTEEYRLVKGYINDNYQPTFRNVKFIRPPEDIFVSLYGIPRSWDEFGVPSSFFNWVPELLVKQLVFEKTKNRELADQLNVQHLSFSEYFEGNSKYSSDTFVLDVARLLSLKTAVNRMSNKE